MSRRQLALAALALAVALPLSACGGDDARPAAPPTGGGSPPAGTPRTRTFRFDYGTRVDPKPGAKRLDAWVPLPLEDDIQRVADLKVEATLDGKPVEADRGTDDAFGNKMAHVGVDDPKGTLALSWSATVTRTGDVGQGKGPVLDRFRAAENLVPITGKAADLAREVMADKTDDPVSARAKRVYDHVLSTMVYDKEAPGWGKGDFERACAVGKGNCTDFHAKFTGIARAAGIPVRFTMGVPLKTDAKGAPAGYHCWAHYWNGASWIPVDVSEAQKIQAKDPAKAQWFHGHLDPDRIALTVGRDIVLSPKQKGPPLLFFAYPYVEVDGEVADAKSVTRTFTYENK